MRCSEDSSEDQKVAWHNVQQAWSKGNVEAACAALTDLIEGEATTDADTWRLWGDTAVALGDLRLASRAYEQARRSLSPNQPGHRWLNRYLYARLQAGATPLGIQEEYYAAFGPPTTLEDQLVGLALEADLHHRLGHIPQASVVGKELLALGLDTAGVAFEFLGHVQGRIWVMLARLAEAAGDVPATCRFLARLDDVVLDPDLGPIVQLLRALLGQLREAAIDHAEMDVHQMTQQLTAVLAADLSGITPSVPAPLLASLHKTLAALQTEADRLSLLDEAIRLRRTNVLARRLYVDGQTQQGRKVGRVLAAEANLWLATHPEQYGKSIAGFLARTSAGKDARFSFVALGGGTSIGGSAYLIDLNGTRLLLDAGLDVGTSPASSYQRLKRGLSQSGIVNSLAELDAVLISHAHLDHIGLLPALYTDPDLPRSKTWSGHRPRIPFYASEATRELARIMLEDAGRLAMATEAKPLYTLDAVAETVDGLGPPKDGLLHLFRNLGQVKLLESGHILGSRMILLEKDDLRVLFTGDFNTRPQLTLPASASIGGLQPDVLIMESTYGYNADEWVLPRDWQDQAFIAHLDRVLRRGGVALLPAFAVGRSQEVLGLVAEHARRNPGLSYGIYLDGLSRTVTGCYDRFDRQLSERYRALRTWINHRLTLVPDDTDREALIREQILRRPNVVIASSGMLKQGSVSYQYAVHIADDPKNAIFYTGYLAEDSEAVAFLSGEKYDLADAGVDVRCEQRRFHFSAHAPKEDLLQFVLDVQPCAVILVHGDAGQRTRVPDNLYALLRRLESDSFRVFLGQEGHRVEHCEGRFRQR
jgi:Cft2 family RNA processing exonuclease